MISTKRTSETWRKVFQAISCRQSHRLRYAEDQVAHINDALGPRSPAMFQGPRP